MESAALQAAAQFNSGPYGERFPGNVNNMPEAKRTETPASKPRILTFGLLAGGSATVALMGPPTPDTKGFGKMELPVNLDGQRFIIPVPVKAPQWERLLQAFGDNFNAWTGAQIKVSDGRVLKQINVEPVADAKGKLVI